MNKISFNLDDNGDPLKSDNYESLCLTLSKLLRDKKELDSKLSEIKDQVIKLAGGDRMEHGIKVTRRTRSGAIAYQSLLDDLELTSDTLEMYRGPAVEYWEVKNY